MVPPTLQCQSVIHWTSSLCALPQLLSRCWVAGTWSSSAGGERWSLDLENLQSLIHLLQASQYVHIGQCTHRNCQGQWVQSRRRCWEMNFQETIWHCCTVARMLFVDLMFTNESCSKHPKKSCFAMVMWYIPKVGTNGDQGYVSLCRCTKRPLGREGAIFIPYCFCRNNLER